MWNKRSNTSGNTNNASNSESQEIQKPSRIRLDVVAGVPNPQDVLTLLAQAQRNPGISCELPIKTADATFMLSCQSDLVSSQPCWTLYEGEAGNIRIWSYNDIDVDTLTNVTTMSVMGKSEQSKADLSSLSPAAPEPAAAAAAAPPPVMASPAMTGSAMANSAPAAAAPSAGQSVPEVKKQGSPWGEAAAASTKQQAQEAPIWNANPSTSVNTGAAGDAAGKFIASLAGRPRITISELTMDPALPSNCVDAVLKLQEMVLKGHFSEKTALEALKLAAQNGGILDEGIINKVQTRSTEISDEGSRGAVQILQQAGLLVAADLTLAQAQAGKHDGDLGAALMAAGKIDELILKAARQGQQLVAKGSLRSDQIIIALHYCQRMRTNLEDALQDLNIDVL